MATRRISALVAGAGIFAMAILTAVPPASAEREFFDISMTGAAEVPGPGDPDGTGNAKVALFPEEGRICYVLEVQGIAPATAAHIHEAPAGSAGPVVVPLEAPTSGRSRECQPIDPALAQEILDNPSAYYVNVHNAEYPAGAVRGQLAREFFDISMTGAAEVPGPGDPDGTGNAKVALFPEEGTICYVLEVQGIAPATAAHIHEAPAGSSGPVVVPLEAPTSGRSRECQPIDPALAQEILDNPSAYYVNVHNAEYPAGAVRGQLA